VTISRKRLEEILSAASKKKIAVIGDLYLDRYGIGTMEGIAREAPVPIVRVRGTGSDTYSPGGGANVCANVADFGPKTYPISVFGDDLHGFELTKQLKARKMDARYIVVDESRVTPTFEKFFASAHGSRIQQVGRVDLENVSPISKASEDRIVESLKEAKDLVDAMIVADYADKPGIRVITDRVLQEVVKIAAKSAVPVISDSRVRIQLFKNTIAVPNEYEATVGAGLYDDRMAGLPPDDVVEKAGHLLNSLLSKPVFVKRGPKAITVFDQGSVQQVPPVTIEGEIDTCGAGDTVDAGIAGSLACGASLLEAAEIGDMAAKVTIKKIGTTGTATPKEILSLYDRYHGRR